MKVSLKVKINGKEQEFPAGTKLIQVIQKVREANQDHPAIQSLIEKTGKDHITFVYNGRIVKPGKYNSIGLREGDEIRWMIPYAGG